MAGMINSGSRAAGLPTLPHAINDFPAFICGIGSLEASLDGPVPKPDGRLVPD